MSICPEEFGKAGKQTMELLEMLLKTGKFERTFQEFSKKKDTNQKILFVEDLLKKHNFIPNFEERKQKQKNSGTSNLYRNEGNECYKQKRFFDALELYNKSLCYAPPGSASAGLAYANRSAVYLAMEHYDKALENIELARKHHYLKEQLDKLKVREEKCLELMNNYPPADQFQENRKVLEKILETKLPANKKAPCYIANCLELRNGPEFGRYIVTNKDLEVGTMIAIEEPFFKRIYAAVQYKRCANCLRKNLLDLIPCDSCCSTMFCSEKCKKTAWQKFHQFECEVVDALEEISGKNMSIVSSRIFLESLHIFNGNTADLENFLESIKNSKKTIFDFDFSKLSETEKKLAFLQVIDGMETHEETREQNEIFTVSIFAAHLSNLFLNHSKLGSILNEAAQAMFRKFIFKYTFICIVNLHALGEVSTSTFKEFGIGEMGAACFPFCSLLSHSCAPNVERISARSKNHFIVSRPIKAGQQIFDNYGFDHFNHQFEERQEKSLTKYSFTCRCDACLLKYPLAIELHPHDRNFKEYSPKFDLFHTREDLERVLEKYESSCRYLQQNDQNYPSIEIRASQICAFVKCMKVFFVSDQH